MSMYLPPSKSIVPLLLQPTIIVSDSLAALTAINNTNSNHPLVTRINILLHTCTKGRSPTSFIGIPSHVGIPGNEEVDKAAKAASSLQYIDPHLLPTKTDLSLFIQQLIRNNWQQQWSSQQQFNHLAKIKPSTAPWPSSSPSSRRLEIIITRLRIGHTRLIHSHVCSHLYL